MKLFDTVKSDLKNDVTWNRAARVTAKGARALPSGTVQYLSDKVPIAGWLPRYNYRWIVNDLIAGLTLGLMLIPQGLSYAKIADIPVEYGLMSSWLPAVLYAFMGSTKDVSTGPTSLIGLLTSENVHALQDRWTPSEIASATAMMMGVYGMILGFLKLGFLLEFISLPVLSGFITAIAITIILNQMDSLLGEDNVGDGAATQIHDIFNQLPNANGWACLIGFTAILFLTILEKSGKRWSKDNKVIWLLSTTRAFLALVLFTGISYAVNKNRDEENYLFEVVKVKSNGQEAPRMPPSDLIPEIAGRSIAVFIGSAVEHLAIARAFAVKNHYTSDQSQELCYLGVTNFFNSFFHAMGVGGAMSRTAVNSSCNVKSPLSGVITMAVILVCIYELVGTLYWIPKAALAAIIITAVWGLISPPSTFYRYWKTSLADFIASMLALWVTLFHSSEVGIGCAVGFNIVYVLLRQVFTRLSSKGADVESSPRGPWTLSPQHPLTISEDTRIFTFNESLIFPNAFGNTTKVLDEVQTYHAPYYSGSHGPETERNWSVVGEKRVARLRKQANISDPSSLPGIGLVVLDFSRVNMLDTTAVTYLKNLVNNLKSYGGDNLEIRFANMNAVCRERVGRAKWRIIEVGSEEESEGDSADAVYLYWDTTAAVAAPRRRGSILTDDGKAHAVHEEKAED
ncbi:hypothetical protein FSARC_8600 [Fusarium sarcochroum]|uniref:STAS domain-containing protein n=1 Tax=Fusarium sarcochroum TaxID=1208366 RepID=A0A8H4TSS5_9HYPO|nr:hypothetical protein FSARC_8600 [Fusarium sarcochroum]